MSVRIMETRNKKRQQMKVKSLASSEMCIWQESHPGDDGKWIGMLTGDAQMNE